MEGNSTVIIAIIIGVVIALLAVALYLLTRNSREKHIDSSQLASRNPAYGPSSGAPVAEPASEEASPRPSPLKPSAEPPADQPGAAAVETPDKPSQPVPGTPRRAVAKKKPIAEEDDGGWGDDDSWDVGMSSDIDSIGETSLEDEFSAGVKSQQDKAGEKPKKLVDRRSSEEDEDDWGDIDEREAAVDDGWAGPTLERVSPEIKQAFKEASMNQEFHVSKRKEADDLIVKCVQGYLASTDNPEVKRNQERVYALHSSIQLSDLPEIVESFVDSGEESNQKHFADFEDMCNTHDDSVLVLFEKFNTTLPSHLRSRRIAEVTDPIPAVIYLAPEWDEGDFDRPDFDERDEDIDEDVDYLEDFYDQLEDDDEDEDDSGKKQA